VTNDLEIAQVLKNSDAKVYICGGMVQKETGSLFGRYATEMLKDFRFDVGFFGDIHSIIDDDNVHSISAPLQVKIDEINYGKAVIYDTTTKLWTREVIDERGELSKFKYTNDKSKHGPDLTTNTYYQYLPERSKSLSETQEAPDWTLIDDLVTKVMEKYELNGLHELIKSKVIFNPINFEFKLSRIKINNFKSLKDFEYDFNDSKRSW
jgi:hypothetical protein